MRGKFKPTQGLSTENTETWNVIPKTYTSARLETKQHKGNIIKTTKYTWLTFFPKNIFEQFHRFANVYFLFIIILNWIPLVNAFGKEIAMLPLIFVLAVTAIKDLIEDRQRYNSDKVVNNRMSDVYNRYILFFYCFSRQISFISSLPSTHKKTMMYETSMNFSNSRISFSNSIMVTWQKLRT